MDQYGCLFIDATWQDMLTAFVYAGQTGDRSGTTLDLEGLFGGSDKCLACFSVRSALDLFLTVMEFPRGSEILVTAINIPDMVAIIEHHGLNVVPVDINIDTLSPRDEHFTALVTSRTVAVLCAHIYGRWTNMDAVVRIAQQHHLFILEDCAECFSGLSNLGHSQTDVTFFSFGAIKYATAMGGAIAILKDPCILSRMRTKMATYPMFPESSYVERLFRYSFVMSVTNNPLIMSFFSNIANFFGIHYNEWTVGLLRGFPGDIITKIRYQPSTSLLRMMLRKLKNFDVNEHARAKVNGDFVLKSLSELLLIPGSKSDILNYWLFPILVDNPKEWVKELAKEKIWTYSGVTQLNLVKPKNCSTTCSTYDNPEDSNLPPDSPTYPSTENTEGYGTCRNHVASDFGCINHDYKELYPNEAKFLIDHVLYLPVHKRVKLKYLDLLCKAVVNVAQRRHPGLVSSKEFLTNEMKLKSKL